MHIGLSDSEGEIPSVKTGKKNHGAGASNNPLVTDLDSRDKKTKRAQKAELWFEKEVFKNLENEDDEDFELNKMAEELKKKGGSIIGESKKGKKKETVNDDDSSGSENSDYDVEEMVAADEKKRKKVNNKNGFEVVKKDDRKYAETRT